MLLGLCLTLPLGGCLLTDKPEPGLDIPQTYDRSSPNPAIAEAALPPLDWWRGFRSRELSEIIEEARAANLDIAAAVARIVQADAQARIAGSALLPVVDLDGNATRSHAAETNTKVVRASLTASYEIDFWGKNRAALRAAEMKCNALFQGTSVDGVYDADPKTNPAALRYDTVDYDTVLADNLKVMDASAVALCRDNSIPIIVFSIREQGNLARVLRGEGTQTIVQKGA